MNKSSYYHRAMTAKDPRYAKIMTALARDLGLEIASDEPEKRKRGRPKKDKDEAVIDKTIESE